MPKKNKESVHLLSHSVDRPPRSEGDWSLETLRHDFDVVVKRLDPDEMEFDMTGIDCILANTLRRVLIAEVPTMAVEKVYMYQNTSVIADEVLAHRIGLIPLKVDPRVFNFPSETTSTSLAASDDPDKMDPQETLLFELEVKCRRTVGKSATKGAPTDEVTGGSSGVENANVYSGQMKWIPLGRQSTFFSEDPSPTHMDILIAKLVAGQEVHFKASAVKGIGRDHSKFSPVATASYRFHPRIKMLRAVTGKDAEELKTCFSEGVIEIDPATGSASIANERADFNSREVLRHEHLADAVSLELDTQHFIFSVESTGALSPPALVEEALGLLVAKCRYYLQLLEATSQHHTGQEQTKSSLSSESVSNHGGRPCGLSVAPDEENESPLDCTFVFTGEDHTLGNSLRYVIMRSKLVNFCGYCNPHPLEDKITFRIQSKEMMAISVLKKGLECLRDVFEHMLTEFKTAVETFQKK